VVHTHGNNRLDEFIVWISVNREKAYVTLCSQVLFMFTLTLWLGRPGGTQEKPSEILFSLEGLRSGSVGGLNPRRSRTLTHSSWYTSCASLGHLQLLQVFLKENKKKNRLIWSIQHKQAAFKKGAFRNPSWSRHLLYGRVRREEFNAHTSYLTRVVREVWVNT
jgi:hypothetical protein